MAKSNPLEFGWPFRSLNNHRLDEIETAIRSNEESTASACDAVRKSNGQIPAAVFGQLQVVSNKK